MHITVQIEAPSALFCSSTPRSGLEEKKHLKQILKVHGGAKTLPFTDWRMLWILVGNRRSPGNRSDPKIVQGFSMNLTMLCLLIFPFWKINPDIVKCLYTLVKILAKACFDPDSF